MKMGICELLISINERKGLFFRGNKKIFEKKRERITK